MGIPIYKKELLQTEKRIMDKLETYTNNVVFVIKELKRIQKLAIEYAKKK